MFVRGDWTRRGLGRLILETCENAARAEGYHRLALLATLPGVPLYRACGFGELETVEVTLVDGVRLTCSATSISVATPSAAGFHWLDAAVGASAGVAASLALVFVAGRFLRASRGATAH